MEKAEIENGLKEIIIEIMGEEDDAEIELSSDTLLIEELGFDSLDLLDLTFNIEEKFDVKIAADELSGRSKGKFKQEELVDEKGLLTELALQELKKSIPEIPSAKLKYGLRESDIPTLLTVSVFTRLIHEKLSTK